MPVSERAKKELALAVLAEISSLRQLAKFLEDPNEINRNLAVKYLKDQRPTVTKLLEQALECEVC